MAQTAQDKAGPTASRKDDVIQIRASAGTKAILNRAAPLHSCF